MRFDGTSVVITGGAGAIGRACAAGFLEAGANVTLVDVGSERIDAAVDELSRRFPDRHVGAIECDVSDQAVCHAMGERVVADFGRIDVGVNLAGIISPAPSIEMPQPEWERVVDINLNGTFYCCQAFARAMTDGGAIVNTSSIAAGTAWPARAAYAATKAAVSQLTQTLAVEWVDRGICVNTVAPGWVDTELLRPAVEEGYIDLDAIRRGIPMHRVAEKRDVVNAIVFLASADASYITGQTLVVDGGYLVGSPSIAIR